MNHKHKRAARRRTARSRPPHERTPASLHLRLTDDARPPNPAVVAAVDANTTFRQQGGAPDPIEAGRAPEDGGAPVVIPAGRSGKAGAPATALAAFDPVDEVPGEIAEPAPLPASAVVCAAPGVLVDIDEAADAPPLRSHGLAGLATIVSRCWWSARLDERETGVVTRLRGPPRVATAFGRSNRGPVKQNEAA